MKKFCKIIGALVLIVIVIFAVKTFFISNRDAGANNMGSITFGSNEVAGTYKNVSLLQDAVLTLNDDDTYDANYNLERYSTFQYEDKGTFSREDGGNCLIFDNDIEFRKVGDKFYYRTSDYEYEPNVDYYDDFCFATDTEYGKAPTFDENGRSNQSFTSIYEVSESVMYGSMEEENAEEKILSLTLRDDGTFVLENIISDPAADAVNTTVESASYQGTYQLDGEFLLLNYDTGKMIFIYTDDKIFFDVYEKQE